MEILFGEMRLINQMVKVSYDLHLMPTSVLLSGGYKNYFIDNAYVNKDILVTGLLASGQTSLYPFDGSMVTTWEIPASSLSSKPAFL